MKPRPRTDALAIQAQATEVASAFGDAIDQAMAQLAGTPGLTLCRIEGRSSIAEIRAMSSPAMREHEGDLLCVVEIRAAPKPDGSRALQVVTHWREGWPKPPDTAPS